LTKTLGKLIRTSSSTFKKTDLGSMRIPYLHGLEHRRVIVIATSVLKISETYQSKCR